MTRHGLPEMAHVVGSVDRSMIAYSARCSLSEVCNHSCEGGNTGPLIQRGHSLLILDRER